MRNIIRLSDPTSHGGSVISVVATNFTVGGIAVAIMGDRCICPIHGEGTITEGDPNHTIGGIPVAYNGHRTSCGATLQATTANFAKN